VALLLQVVPIVVFLVVDALVDSALWAIVSALAFVVLQTVITLARGKPLDRFLLLDLALVGAMGGASLLTRSEVFFKLKPAVLEGVMVPFLLFLALAPERMLQGYLGRYALGAGGVNPAALPVLRRMVGLMGVLVLAHAGLTVVAALHWSKRAWGLISGPGFYALLVPLLGYTLLVRLRLRRAAATAARAAATAPPPSLTPPRASSARLRARARRKTSG
jgi:hypothetical protein